MELKDILEQHAGMVMDKQHMLGEMLGAHDWGADTGTGIFFFNGPNIDTPFEIIGTVSNHTGEWLWGWANASLPGDLAVISGALRDFGAANNIEYFTRDRLSKDETDLHAIGIAACGIGGAKAYYIADYGDGILLAALTGDQFLDAWQPDHPRVFSVFPRLIQIFELDHKAALKHYLAGLGYEVSDNNGVLAEKNGQSVKAAFDEAGRLVNLASA